MFSLLSQAATRTFFSTVEVRVGLSSGCKDEQEVLNVNVEELYALVRPLPELAWHRVSDLYSRTVAPAYRALRTTLNDDVEGLAQLFVDLEVTSEREAQSYFEPADRDVLPSRLKRCPSADSIAELSSQRPPRARRRSSSRSRSPQSDDGAIASGDLGVLVITNADPALPAIVVTRCPSQLCTEACRVPYQDAAFGARLPVPTHPALNDVHPPLVARPFPLVARWRYERGHWRAQLPPVQEQMSRGMFSRPLSTRRLRAQQDAARDAERAHAARGRVVYSRSSHREV